MCRVYQQKRRNKLDDEGRCANCGRKVDSFHRECDECRRWHYVRMAGLRHFMRDFK